MSSNLFAPSSSNLRRPHSSDDLLNEKQLDKSFVRPRPKPAPRNSRSNSPSVVLQVPVPAPRSSVSTSVPRDVRPKENVVGQSSVKGQDDADSLIILSPANRKKVASEFFNLDLDSLYAQQKPGQRTSANLTALNLESSNSEWYNSDDEAKVSPAILDSTSRTSSGSQYQYASSYLQPINPYMNTSQASSISYFDPMVGYAASPDWTPQRYPAPAPAKPLPYMGPVERYPKNPYWTKPALPEPGSRPTSLPSTGNDAWKLPAPPNARPQSLQQGKSVPPNLSHVFPQSTPQNGDLLDLSKDLLTDTRNITLSSFDPFAEPAERGSSHSNASYISLENDPFQALWDSRATANAAPDPFQVPAAKNVTYEKLNSYALTPAYAQLDQPLFEEKNEDISEDGIYESVHIYESIRDPFSLTELNQVLEHQRKVKDTLPVTLPGGQYANNNKPARPPRPATIVAEEAAMFEPLRHTVGADFEELAFCDMVAKMKADYTYEVNITNQGFLVSPVVENVPYANMSVKVSVETKFASEPVVFTCDLATSVEHMVVQVLSVLTDDLDNVITDDFVFKVHGVSEYLVNESRLGDYAYAHYCLKMDEDIQLVLSEVGNMNKSLLRTFKDDQEPVLLTRSNFQQVVNRETLGILMDTFYKEIEKVRDQVMKNNCERLKSQSLVQSVKAICAILGNIETNTITSNIQRLNLLSEIELGVTEETLDTGAIYATIDKSRDNAKKIQVEEFQHAVDQLVVSVKHLIKAYCKAFHSDFTFGSLEQPIKETKEVTSFLDCFIVELESAHRLPADWRNMYESFCILCALYHGGRKVHSEVTTSKVQISDSFTEKLCWDEWIQMNLPVCTLPRECRLVLSLVGIKTVPNPSGAEPGQQVRVSLGWSALQVFDYKGMLVQGSQLLPLWSGDPQPLGTTLANRSNSSVLLKIGLPDFGCNVEFPKVMDSPESHACDFSSLHLDMQEELQEIVARDVITTLTTEESEFLWEKRHYLYRYPKALPKILDYCHGWDWACLPDLHAMVSEWDPLEPAQALELLLPRYADTHVRRTAVRWIKAASSDELIDFLPQLIQALKFESYSDSPLARFLLERAVTSIRVAHHLFWGLRDAVDNSPHYRERYQLVLRALLSLVGGNLKQELDKQEAFVLTLSDVAESVRAAKDKEVVLMRELEKIYSFLQDSETIRVPLNPSMEITGIDLKLCSYFNSFTTPLKLVFKNVNPKAGSIYTMFKVGDDLRQDMLIMQMVYIVNKMWIRDKLDLKIITFSCLPTGPKKGMIELITGCETLRKIQVSHAGLAGSFKDKPLYDWLQKHNPTELEYTKAVANFTASCAGYCVMTYVLGICDRHNDNIMIKETGHMFHIDFAKILGDSQMFGNIKRDRVPFVLTSDMAYVINGGDKPSEKFQDFVDLCCRAFNIIRHNTDVLLNLILLMSSSGIPGVTTTAASYVQKSLLPGFSDAEATAFFTRMIEESLKSVFTQINFFFHNLAQLKFHGHDEGELLSFIPKTYSLQTDGKIRNVEVHGYQKRYSPEKYYVYVIKVERINQKVSSFVFRRYSEFLEFHNRLVMTFPLAKMPTLPSRLILGRSHVKTVAERRKMELEAFLKKLLDTAPEIAECDLVYTFFHPMLRDEQEVDKANLPKLRESVVKRTSVVHSIGGQVKLSTIYKDGALYVMVMHAKNLANCGGDEPDSYVKTYLLPDAQKLTKRKTKICRNTFHPTFNEMLIYHQSYEEILLRTLQVSVWNDISVKENEFLGTVHIKLREVDLSTEEAQWYNLCPQVS